MTEEPTMLYLISQGKADPALRDGNPDTDWDLPAIAPDDWHMERIGAVDCVAVPGFDETADRLEVGAGPGVVQVGMWLMNVDAALAFAGLFLKAIRRANERNRVKAVLKCPHCGETRDLSGRQPS